MLAQPAHNITVTFFSKRVRPALADLHTPVIVGVQQSSKPHTAVVCTRFDIFWQLSFKNIKFYTNARIYTSLCNRLIIFCVNARLIVQIRIYSIIQMTALKNLLTYLLHWWAVHICSCSNDCRNKCSFSCSDGCLCSCPWGCSCSYWFTK